MPRCAKSFSEILDVITLTQELVKINSTPSAKHTDNSIGETYLANWITDYLSDFGFTCNSFPVTDNRPNLIARHAEFNPGLPTIALEAHLDTVSVENMKIEPFAAVLKDGRIYGRGATDVKGTMAVFLTTLLNWYKEHAFKPGPFNLLFIATMGEEGGTFGARELVKRPIPINMVIVGEPTGFNPVVAHNGTWRFKISTTGKSCHSSTPELGINAVENMAEVLNLMMNVIKPSFEKYPRNVMSITNIHGGDQINIIPNLCEIVVDCRYRPGTDISGHRALLLAELEKHSTAQYNEILLYPPYKTRENSKLLDLLEKSLRQKHVDHKQLFAPWYSDAGHFSAAGYDTVIWGAGDMKQAHTEDEYILVNDLHKGVELMENFLLTCIEHFQK